MKHLLNKTLLTSGALASLLLSASLTSCQDENLGFSQEEIHQTYLDRKYAEEFAKAFPNVDPNHTWMCAPDTFGVESLIGSAITRAYNEGDRPSVAILPSTKTVDENFIKSALVRLPEEEDNRGTVTQSFDYLAAEDNGTPNDNFAEYTITPTFWGRKFCGSNSVGIYWIDNEGGFHKEDIFWHDYSVPADNDNGKNNNIKVKYTDGTTEDLYNSEYQIDHNIVWTNYAHDYPLGRPCNKCGVEYHAFPRYSETSYLSKNDKDGGSQQIPYNKLLDDPQEVDYKCVKLVSPQSPNNTYDTQLMVTSPTQFTQGDKVKFSMKYLVKELKDENSNNIDKTTANIGYQLHNTSSPQSFKDGGITKYQIEKCTWSNSNHQWNWKTLDFEVDIPENGINKICIDLNPKKTVYVNGKETTVYEFGENQTIYITEVSWRKESCGVCKNLGYHPVDKFILPQYLVKIPVGMRWGFYLDTKKQQNSNDYVQWYSNAKYNEIEYNSQKKNVSAAATYQGADGLVYCCFEDAACNLHNGGPNGNCDCGYGHFDTDFNDFAFAIEGRPVITSYQSLKYRVMCEDLGGTWDWDFNDVVYDVEYADAEDGVSNATVKVTLQAVGGTLPVKMQFATAFSSENIIRSTTVPNGSDVTTTQDLHEVLDNSNSTNAKELYTPVNVTPSANQQTVTGKDPQLVCTYTLNAAKYPNFDARRFAELITIKVNQKPLNVSGENTTTTVHFPTAKGDANLIPECFMTSINADWTAENQKITAKYPNFENWVKDNKNNIHWWDVGIGQ